MKMNNIVAVVALCVSMQAFAWKITFDPSTYGHTFEIFTFESEGDYKRMAAQTNVAGGILKFLGVIAPIAGKIASASAAAKTKESAHSNEYSFDADEKEPELYYTPNEIAAINASIGAGTEVLQEVVKSGWLSGLIEGWTKEGYTIDYIEAFRPSKGNDLQCRNADSLKKHLIHPIKSNKIIFFVLFDRTTQKAVYANWAPAYGEFTFALETLVAAGTNAKAVVGNLKEISATGGQICTK